MLYLCSESPASIAGLFFDIHFMLSIPLQIQEFLLPITEKLNAFVVDVVLRGERSSKVIEVYVDSDGGISLDECSEISRALSEKLDETDLIQGRYRLDVSSPGVERPLKIFRQYRRNVGRMCKVIISEEGKKVVREGILDAVSEKTITINKNKKMYEILFSDIQETYVIPQIK